MKRIFILITAVVFSFAASAQTGVWGNVRIHDNLNLKGKTINRISNDSTLQRNDSVSLVTEWAVKNFLTNRLGNLTVATGKTFIVPSKDSMLNLTGTAIGDVSVIPDSSKSYILRQQPATDFSNWVLLLFPGNVPSVFGRSGPIMPQFGDYDYSQIANTPPLFNPIPGKNINITGAFPNLTFNSEGGVVISQVNYFPAIGDLKTLYVDTATNFTYSYYKC